MTNASYPQPMTCGRIVNRCGECAVCKRDKARMHARQIQTDEARERIREMRASFHTIVWK